MRARAIVSLLAGGLVGQGAVGAELFVAPGDTGRAVVTVRNDAKSEEPVEAFTFAVQEHPSFQLESAADLTPADIPPGGSRVFNVGFSVPPAAPSGPVEILLAPLSLTPGLQINPKEKRISYVVDSLKPSARVFDAFGVEFAAGKFITTQVKVQGTDPDDGSASGVESIRVAGTSVYGENIDLTRSVAGGPLNVVEFFAGRTDPLTSGLYTATVQDRAGNVSAPVEFKVDIFEPEVSDQNPLPSQKIRGNTRPPISFELDEDLSGIDLVPLVGGKPKNIRVYVNGILAEYAVYQSLTPVLAESYRIDAIPAQELSLDPGRVHTILVEAVDKAGNALSESWGFSFANDTTPPALTAIEALPPYMTLPLNRTFIGGLTPNVWFRNGARITPPVKGLRFELADGNSGLKSFLLTRAAENFNLEAQYPPPAPRLFVEAEFLPDKPIFGESIQNGYVMTISDWFDNQTEIQFGVDSTPPVLDYKLRVSDAFEVRAVGEATDAGSGVVLVDRDPIPATTVLPPRGSPTLPIDVVVSSIPLGATPDVTEPPTGIAGVDAAALLNNVNPIRVMRGRLVDAAIRLPTVTGGDGWVTAPNYGNWANRLTSVRASANCVYDIVRNECEGSVTTQIYVRSIKHPQPPPSEGRQETEIDYTGHYAGDQFTPNGLLLGTFVSSAPTPPPAQAVNVFLGDEVQFKVIVNPPPAPVSPGQEGSVAAGFSMETIGGFAFQNVAMQPVPVGLNVTFAFPNLLVNLVNVTAPGGRIAYIPGLPVSPPRGYVTPPGLQRNRGFDLINTAALEGGMDLEASYAGAAVSPAEAARLKLFHLKADGQWEDVTVSVRTQDKKVLGRSQTASPFAIFIATAALEPDTVPPVSTAAFVAGEGRQTFAESDAQYLDAAGSVVLTASDAGSGVLDTFYAVDPSTELLAAGFSETTVSSFSRYTEALSIAEGLHVLAFGSVDTHLNYEALRTAEIRVDATAPEVSFVASGSSFSLVAVDPPSSGAASGIGEVFYLVDVSPAECETAPEDPNAPPGTCANADYAGPFALAPGSHTVHYGAVDRVGNGADVIYSTTVVVGGAATITPSSGPIGAPVLITGSGFGASAGKVLFGGATAPITSWTDAEIAASVPNLSTGAYPISIETSQASVLPAGTFLVIAPVLVSIDPASALAGATATLSGSGFGPFDGERTRVLFGGTTAQIAAWSDTAIALTVPGVAPGTIAVVVERASLDGGLVRSGALSFEVIEPEVSVTTPVFTFSIGRKDSDVIVDAIRNPTGVAVRSDGRIWVASVDKDELILLEPSGAVATIVAEGLREFKNPQGLAVDSADRLYVADKGNNRVVKLSPDGGQVLLQIAKLGKNGKPKQGSGPGELKKPTDVAVDANGDVYVADAGNRRIQVFDAAGGFLRQFGQDVLLSTSEVSGIALTSEGLWVSDRELEVVHLFSREGVSVKTIGDADSVVGEISRMRGLAADASGALYVVEPNRDRVQKFDRRGRGLLAFGSREQATPAERAAKRWLIKPIDAATAPDGSIWVTDTGRDRVVRYAAPAAGFAAAAYSSGGEAPLATEPAKRVVDYKDGGKVERDDGAGVRVPKGALSGDLEITVDSGDDAADRQRKAEGRKDKGIAAASEEVRYGPPGTLFSAPVTLTLPYSAGRVEALGIREEDLKVYYWNASLGRWEALASSVDKQNKTVSAQTNHFSIYQAMGGAGFGVATAAQDEFYLREHYAFPNPVRSGVVTFRVMPGLADTVEVRVYDVAGRKVYSSSDFTHTAPGGEHQYDHAWSISGIGSGVYTYAIKASRAGQKTISKTGKVGVVR